MTEQDLSNGGHAMDKQLQALQHNLEAAVQRAWNPAKPLAIGLLTIFVASRKWSSTARADYVY